ncbi:hypothetical protein [Rhodococcoides fascians]|uniref:hypothetical protein n=1 Tax=Rhodococcoides fascians TaxID=1828 RepID=UPI001E5F0ACF|nr:hypothetical protein [Rhodococcus fascians]
MTDSGLLDRIRTVSVVVTIVAVGVVVASFIPSRETGSSTTGNFVSAPVDVSADIPGCDTVEPPVEDEGGLYSRATFGGDSTYDNPAFPWFTAAKAAAMSEAVRAAVPADVEIELAAPSNSLNFGPVTDFGDSEFDPMTTAYAELTRDGVTAFVSVNVGPSSDGVPPCVAGALERRDIDADGTVVDSGDSWYEIDGVRTYSRSATAYREDGTRVSVYQSAGSSPAMPLEQQEAAAIASIPELAMSAPSPAESPVLQVDCSVYPPGDGTVKDLSREAVDAANAAFTASWAAIPDAPALDRPIGSLVPDGFGSGICTDVGVGDGTIRLAVSVAGGQPLPTAPDPYDPSFYGQLPVLRTLPDGSVVEFLDTDITQMMTSEDGTGLLSRSVTVTRPSGVQVSARSTVEIAAGGRAPLTLPEPLSAEVLDAVANTPIGQWP